MNFSLIAVEKSHSLVLFTWEKSIGIHPLMLGFRGFVPFRNLGKASLTIEGLLEFSKPSLSSSSGFVGFCLVAKGANPRRSDSELRLRLLSSVLLVNFQLFWSVNLASRICFKLCR